LDLNIATTMPTLQLINIAIFLEIQHYYPQQKCKVFKQLDILDIYSLFTKRYKILQQKLPK